MSFGRWAVAAVGLLKTIQPFRVLKNLRDERSATVHVIAVIKALKVSAHGAIRGADPIRNL